MCLVHCILLFFWYPSVDLFSIICRLTCIEYYIWGVLLQMRQTCSRCRRHKDELESPRITGFENTAPYGNVNRWPAQQHIAPLWVLEFATTCSSTPRRFSVNVWANTVGDHLIRPYLLPPPLEGRAYFDHPTKYALPSSLTRNSWRSSCSSVVIELLNVVLAWWAPPHYKNDIRQHLNVTFWQHGINGDPVHWPVRSTDLSCMDFFSWGEMKTLV